MGLPAVLSQFALQQVHLVLIEDVWAIIAIISTDVKVLDIDATL